MARRIEALLIFVAAVGSVWLYSSSSLRSTVSHGSAMSSATPTVPLSEIFVRADVDGDGKLSFAEFGVAGAELSAPLRRTATPTSRALPDTAAAATTAAASVPTTPATPTYRDERRIAPMATVSAAAAAVPQPATPASATTAPSIGRIGPMAATMAGPAAQAELPKCSLLFFYHIVKTAGTTMRTILQRQAQLGEFEYHYTDTTKKPRWHLLMHQLSHHVAPRRAIFELHSEWGLPISFYADVRRIRSLYEPLGCRVTLATVLRHPLNLYLSWFNWRASNYLPLCAWDPPRDLQSRQLLGWGLPFVMPTQSSTRVRRGQGQGHGQG